MPINHITLMCFGASYGVALVLELALLFWPGKVLRWLRTGFTAAGLLAHTLFLLVQRPPLATQFGSLLFLAWILAVFSCYGSLHHRRLAWGIFVLPLVLALVLLADLFAPGTRGAPGFLDWERFWGVVHGGLLLLAAVGVCVGFLASVMYLVQAHRLKAKALPGQGFRMLSLERLEQMNRRAINLAFPLLTAGVIIGAVLLVQDHESLHGWLDPKVIGAVLLWVLFVLLLYLRYGVHLRGRGLALLTILAFALMLLTLASPAHHFLQAVPPGP